MKSNFVGTLGAFSLLRESDNSKSIAPEHHTKEDWEVVGNIYENPDLLSGHQKSGSGVILWS
jgi:hypothetical protein